MGKSTHAHVESLWVKQELQRIRKQVYCTTSSLCKHHYQKKYADVILHDIVIPDCCRWALTLSKSHKWVKNWFNRCPFVQKCNFSCSKCLKLSLMCYSLLLLIVMLANNQRITLPVYAKHLVERQHWHKLLVFLKGELFYVNDPLWFWLITHWPLALQFDQI